MEHIDEDLFERKYDEYGEMLYRIAYLFVANASDAEDILQDVFVQLLYSAPAFKDAEHEKAWLIRVTQNHCKNLLKSSGRKNVPLDDLQSLHGTTVDTDMRLDVIRQVIALPFKYKSAVILYYYNDYPVEKIAKVLNISKSAVKMRLKKGRELLKLELEEYGYGEK